MREGNAVEELVREMTVEGELVVEETGEALGLLTEGLVLGVVVLSIEGDIPADPVGPSNVPVTVAEGVEVSQK